MHREIHFLRLLIFSRQSNMHTGSEPCSATLPLFSLHLYFFLTEMDSTSHSLCTCIYTIIRIYKKSWPFFLRHKMRKTCPRLSDDAYRFISLNQHKRQTGWCVILPFCLYWLFLFLFVFLLCVCMFSLISRVTGGIVMIDFGMKRQLLFFYFALHIDDDNR